MAPSIGTVGVHRTYPPTVCLCTSMGFPDGSAGKESACSVGDTGDMGSIPGLGRPPGVGNGIPFQYSCLENSMERGARWATDHGIAESQTHVLHWAHTHFTSPCTPNCYMHWAAKEFMWLTLPQYLLIMMAWKWTCNVSELCLNYYFFNWCI